MLDVGVLVKEVLLGLTGVSIGLTAYQGWQDLCVGRFADAAVKFGFVGVVFQTLLVLIAVPELPLANWHVLQYALSAALLVGGRIAMFTQSRRNGHDDRRS